MPAVDVCYSLVINQNLTYFMKAVSFLGNGVTPFILVLVAALLMALSKNRGFALLLLATSLFGEITKQLIKFSLAWPRPESLGCSVIASGEGYSMPSGHVIFYTIFFGLVFFYALNTIKNKAIKAFVATLSLFFIVFVGPSRIYLGAHWVTDVIVGYLIGFLILFIAIGAYRRVENG